MTINHVSLCDLKGTTRKALEWKVMGEGDITHALVMTEDELDLFRRALGVGMGDCDHCDELQELRKLYAESRVMPKDTSNILTRIARLEEAISGHGEEFDNLGSDLRGVIMDVKNLKLKVK